MTLSNDAPLEQSKGLRRTGVLGLATGALALLACELPIVLALIGFGGLSTAAAALKPPFFVELAAVVLGATGIILLIALAIRRKRSGKRSTGS